MLIAAMAPPAPRDAEYIRPLFTLAPLNGVSHTRERGQAPTVRVRTERAAEHGIWCCAHEAAPVDEARCPPAHRVLARCCAAPFDPPTGSDREWSAPSGDFRYVALRTRHAWIAFEYGGELLVFPRLSILILKSQYFLDASEVGLSLFCLNSSVPRIPLSMGSCLPENSFLCRFRSLLGGQQRDQKRRITASCR